MTPIDLNVLQNEPAEVYHGKAKENLSSHQLIDFMRCPPLYQRRQAGLVEEKETSAYFLGRAAHCRILEGLDVYEREFAIGGPINPSTGKPFGSTTKKFLEWQEAQRKPVISFEKAELINAMNVGVRQNPYACQLLEHGKAEGVVRAMYRGLPCQIRIDWTNPELGIVDLKTCDDLVWFESDARRFGYHHQLAFYQNVLGQVIGQLVPVYIIAVEKKEPYRCGVWQLPSETLQFARGEIEAAIERLKIAKAEDHWITGYEELRMLSIV
jgi:hypothetical protein